MVLGNIKTCNNCNKKYFQEHFNQKYCPDCRKELRKAYIRKLYAVNPEKYRRYRKQYLINNPDIHKKILERKRDYYRTDEYQKKRKDYIQMRKKQKKKGFIQKSMVFLKGFLK